MELNDIKIFYEVVQQQSTIKAAEKLGYTQSNISKRIAKLEEELGILLFQRTNKGMSLTVNGEQFIPYAEKFLALTNEVDTLFSKNNVLKIGTTQTLSRNYFEPYYVRPEVDIFISPIHQLIEDLKKHTLDFIVVNTPLAEHGLIQVDSFEESITCIGTTTDIPMIFLVSRDPYCPYRKVTLEYLETPSLKDAQIIEMDTFDSLLHVLSHESVAAILPQKVLSYATHLTRIPLDSLIPSITIYTYAARLTSKKFHLAH